MVVALKSTDVFTPNEFPAYTYVERGPDFERQVMNGIRTPNIIVSVSGPSKAGKSVLLQKVVGQDYLIRIFGPQIKSPDDLWSAVLDWMGSPSSSNRQASGSTAITAGGGADLTLGLKGIASITAKGDGNQTTTSVQAQSATYGRGGLSQVVREIGGSDFVVFVDDFHYIDRALQPDVAKHVKAAAELGIKICVASVPHRSDDVVRANSELRGRVLAVDMEYWSASDLGQIGLEGFPQLNMDIPRKFVEQLANEACGSPQLMQALCLQTCFSLNVDEKLQSRKKYVLGSDELQKILESTSALSDFSTVLEAMHEGPKLRGQDRKQYELQDGSQGDVYRAVLLAIGMDPPVMSFTYRQLMNRVTEVCVGQPPVGSSVSEACSQIDKIARRSADEDTGVQGLPPIEWDTSADVENLHIVEPYFLFYLRSSSKLRRLGGL